MKCGQNLFNQPVKNNVRAYVNIKKIAIVNWDDYTPGCLHDYNHFKDYYKTIAIDLSEQQPLADPKALQKK